MCNICVDKINAIEGWRIEYSVPNYYTNIVNKNNDGGYLIPTDSFHNDIYLFVRLCNIKEE